MVFFYWFCSLQLHIHEPIPAMVLQGQKVAFFFTDSAVHFCTDFSTDSAVTQCQVIDSAIDFSIDSVIDFSTDSALDFKW